MRGKGNVRIVLVFVFAALPLVYLAQKPTSKPTQFTKTNSKSIQTPYGTDYFALEKELIESSLETPEKVPNDICADVPNPFGTTWMKRWQQLYGARLFDATVIDLDTGCTFHAGTPGNGYPTASTGKVMIATQNLRNVDAGKYSQASISRDLKLMILNSDNDAGTRLYKKIGRNAGIQKVVDTAHLSHTRPFKGWGTIMTTSGDQAKLLRQLFIQKSLLKSRSTTTLRKLMHAVGDSSKWGIGVRRPSGWSALQKNGWHYSRPGIDTPPTGGWRINSLAVLLDQNDKPRWIVTGYGNTFPSQTQGMKSWTALGAHVAAVFGASHTK